MHLHHPEILESRVIFCPPGVTDTEILYRTVSSVTEQIFIYVPLYPLPVSFHQCSTSRFTHLPPTVGKV